MTLPSETGTAPVGKSVRRLRGFLASFADQVARTQEQTGTLFDIRQDRLSATFLDWIAEFEAQKPRAESDKIPYVGFAAGLMLKSLLRHAPVSVRSLPPGANTDAPAWFWPEGHLYVSYCLNVRGSVLAQDFHTPPRETPALEDVRTWWTFRENVAEDPSLAIAFLNYFSGEEADWTMPDVFRSGQFRAHAQTVLGAE